MYSLCYVAVGVTFALVIMLGLAAFASSARGGGAQLAGMAGGMVCLIVVAPLFAVLLIVESWLPIEQQRPAYIARCWSKLVAVLDQMERDVPGYQRLDIGQMRTVGALQFLRLKLPVIGKAASGIDPGYDPLAGRPRLAEWLKPMLRKKLFREPLLRPE